MQLSLYPCKREIEGDLSAHREGRVTRDAEIRATGPQAKERWQPPEAQRGKEQILPPEPPE